LDGACGIIAFSDKEPMDLEDDENFLEHIVQLRDGYDVEAVERFSDRLIRLAKSRLPDRLQRRVDPEDIVQSVFRSFFARHESGKFEFDQAPDVWRLLAAITYHKVQHSIRRHHRQQRDFKREVALDGQIEKMQDIAPTASSIVMMMEFLDQILNELPVSHREIVRLRMEGHSIAEIAKLRKVSTRTVLRALKLVRTVASEIDKQA
jgi:RNA polymerase sigma-70 factor (ECF subfamily)